MDEVVVEVDGDLHRILDGASPIRGHLQDHVARRLVVRQVFGHRVEVVHEHGGGSGLEPARRTRGS
jgi:hypothetical protein